MFPVWYHSKQHHSFVLLDFLVIAIFSNPVKIPYKNIRVVWREWKRLEFSGDKSEVPSVPTPVFHNPVIKYKTPALTNMDAYNFAGLRFFDVLKSCSVRAKVLYSMQRVEILKQLFNTFQQIRTVDRYTRSVKDP